MGRKYSENCLLRGLLFMVLVACGEAVRRLLTSFTRKRCFDHIYKTLVASLSFPESRHSPRTAPGPNQGAIAFGLPDRFPCNAVVPQ